MPRPPHDLHLEPPIPALHPERDALLAAVRDADPADDLPALVYADWQDEHGQPEHAELIRVMCELGRLKPRAKATESQRDRLLARISELFNTPALQPLWAMVVRDRMKRGFDPDLCVRWMVLSGERFVHRLLGGPPNLVDTPSVLPFDNSTARVLWASVS